MHTSAPGCATAERRRGQSLIGLLAVVLILIALYFMFLGGRVDKNGTVHHSVARQSIDRAKDTATNSNIQQIQTAIMMFKNDNERLPASLDELKSSSYGKGFPPEMWVDATTGKPLAYDPATGRVWVPSDTAGAPAPNAAAGAAGSSGANSNPPVPGGSITIPQPKTPSESGDQ